MFIYSKICEHLVPLRFWMFEVVLGFHPNRIDILLLRNWSNFLLQGSREWQLLLRGLCTKEYEFLSECVISAEHAWNGSIYQPSMPSTFGSTNMRSGFVWMEEDNLGNDQYQTLLIHCYLSSFQLGARYVLIQSLSFLRKCL